MKISSALERIRVPAGRARLALRPEQRPGWRPAGLAKGGAARRLARGVERLAALQERLWAEDRRAVLVVLQGMDAAGKDGVIRHVMSGLNPQGCEVRSFKAPSAEELDHDYLWRVTRALPERGRIGIFNRSHYEEVLVVRVHPELLAAQRLPPGAAGPGTWRRRFREINAFERRLADNGTLVLKFFLHVSREEQRRRFLERIRTPAKNWKFSAADLRERGRWEDYRRAYHAMLAATSTPWAPWHVVPADHKWVTRLLVAEALIGGLEGLGPSFPALSREQRAALREAGRALERPGA